MVSATAMALLLVAPQVVRAELITLDFDTPETGSGILDAPLIIPAGSITARNVDSFTTVMGTGNALEYREPVDGFATLEFDFDVRRITLIYTGNVTGVFNAIVRDAKDNIVDSFFNPDTGGQLIWGPITLSGNGIRKFEFADAPDGALLAAVDNVEISLVPEPANWQLSVWGIVGLAGIMSRRR
jgi:hypothetical protein